VNRIAGRSVGPAHFDPLKRNHLAAGCPAHVCLSIWGQFRVELLNAHQGYLSQNGCVTASRSHHQIVTSWDSLYRLLGPAFPDKFYHQGREVLRLEEYIRASRYCFVMVRGSGAT
jgi:hypothetical protein